MSIEAWVTLAALGMSWLISTGMFIQRVKGHTARLDDLEDDMGKFTEEVKKAFKEGTDELGEKFDKLNETLTGVRERLASVETKVDIINGGKP